MGPLTILGAGIAIVLVAVLFFRLHPFLALIFAAATVATLTPQTQIERYANRQVEKGKWTDGASEKFIDSTVMERVATAFGETCGKVGILIAMAAVIGKCLLDSGSAERIVRSFVHVLGQAQASLGFIVSGFLLGIPVFFDTVFYLMIPLGKAMRLRTGGNYLLYILSIMAGATMAHSLVPPTPGPLFVADRLGVNLGLMIGVGILVGIVASMGGFAFALLANRWWDIPLRDTPDTNLADLHSLVKRSDDDLPPLWIALAPILLPVGLITLDTAMTSFVNSASIENAQMIPAVCIDLIHAFGNKNTAITLSAVVSMIVLSRYQNPSKEQLTSGIQGALASGGLIILITSAGGAFGETIRHCGITERIESLTTDVPSFWLLPLAFGVTTVMRTAQGSATVAMMTSSSILQYLAHGDQLGFHPVYIAAAIGCGSKPIAWMNDSGFWVICKMSGMTETEGLRTITPMSIIMGFTGLGATMVFARFFPLLEL